MSTLPERPRRGDAQPVGDVLARYLRASGLKDKLRSSELYDCWPEVAGAEACRHTRVVGFDQCVLYVEVDSAPWLHLLATFKKPELLRGLALAVQGMPVKDIKFRIGAAAGTAADAPEANAPGRDACPTHRTPPTTRGTSRSCPA